MIFCNTTCRLLPLCPDLVHRIPHRPCCHGEGPPCWCLPVCTTVFYSIVALALKKQPLCSLHIPRPKPFPLTCATCAAAAPRYPLQVCNSYNTPGLGLALNLTNPAGGVVLDGEGLVQCLSTGLCTLNTRRAGNASWIGQLTHVSCGA